MKLIARRNRFIKYFRRKVPEFKLGIGYGSGMKPQLNYDYGEISTETTLKNQNETYSENNNNNSNSDSQQFHESKNTNLENLSESQENSDLKMKFPIMDVILVSQNVEKFNTENLEMDNSNPGMMIRMLEKSGLNLYTYIQKHFFPLVYYISEDEGPYRFKYGVVEDRDFLDDLEVMNYFTIAGRMQKPVYLFKGFSEEGLNTADLFKREGYEFFEGDYALQEFGKAFLFM